ncbi:hypothetical protein ACQPYA_12985 [Micromonospora sp. CA-263727]|uniref:hypothetical protein n=1 Tax=Micromonospora sp. CA-263727 TaxID=3239967 RepID=UPI003D93BFB6
MTRALGNTIAAELVKLRGLPAVLATALGTVAAAVTLTAAVAASSTDETDAVRVTLLTIPFLQVGTILLGVLTAASEYQGSQVRTTLTATPNRPLLLAGKTLAYLAAAAITSVAAVGAGRAAAATMLATRDPAPTGGVEGWALVGAAGYLVLIGLLGFALTVLLRSLIPPLVTMLALVLIVSPLTAGYTEHARWLPDRAGSLLYLPTADTVLTAETGALILLAWITATGSAASVIFARRDA